MATPSSRPSWLTIARTLPKRRRTTRICTAGWVLATISRTCLPGRRSAPSGGALTLQYDKILFILEPVEQAKAAIGKRVSVSLWWTLLTAGRRSATAESNLPIGFDRPHQADQG